MAENIGILQREEAKSCQLTNEQRKNIFEQLLKRMKGKKLQHGAINEVAKDVGVTRLTVSKIWKMAQGQYNEGKISADVSSKKKKKCGRKPKDYSENISKIKNIPFNQRSTIRCLARAIDVPRSSLFDILKKGNKIKRISSTVKPLLTEKNKQDRLKFCLSNVDQDGKFADLYDHVFIDEKWFYITRNKRSYYVAMDEEVYRTCKSKRFVTKVMFMAAVARPRYDPHQKRLFNGKIGIWPFVFQEPAKRNSKNRPKGTHITKNVESINATECKKMIIDNVIPAIKSQFPTNYKKKIIYVQQDNAKPHPSVADAELLAAGTSCGWSIRFKSQPPNSPDLNILDLGFFNSIQSLQHEASPKTIDDLIKCVQDAFDELGTETLDDVFLTLQNCMESIMLVEGGNNYKIQHINKAKLRREGRLPSNLICSQEAIERANTNINCSL